MNKSERLYFLYHLFLSAAASEQESKELFELADDPENETIFHELMDSSWDELAEIESLNFIPPPAKKLRSFNLFNQRHSYWAAAAVFFIAGLTIFFIIRQNAASPDIKQIIAYKAPANEILPGNNKATLSLANGQQIALDDSAIGSVATQGNVKIIKLKNGKIKYLLGDGITAKYLYNIITTPRGGQYQIVLPDGSKVWLNAASSLRFPVEFSADDRRVELTGEAYFEVAKDKHRPFFVKVNDEQVKVLGTHFNIMAYSEEPSVKTTLAEGAVKIISGINTAILKPGEQSQVKEGKIKILNDKDIVEEALAWKNGNFMFMHPTNIKTIMNQISRWYDVDIEYHGDVSGMDFLGTTSRKGNITELLKIFEATGTIQFEIKNKKINVIPK